MSELKKDNPGQNTKGYLLHRIHFKFKHPIFLDGTNI